VATAGQRRGEHIPMVTDTDAIIGYGVFSLWSMPRLYNDYQLDKPVSWRSESAASSIELHC
jgi:hypothetical protein